MFSTLFKSYLAKQFIQNCSVCLVAVVLVFKSVINTQAQSVPIEVQPFVSDLDFGIIANENGICRMNDRGSLLGLSGQSCLGRGSRAVFDIQGEPGRVIYLTVAGSQSQGILFEPKLSGSPTKVISPNGNTLVVVAGDLQLQNAQGGKHSLDFILCVHYE